MSVDTIAPPDTPVAILDRLERAAQCLETPCGDGTMLWHSWGRGPALVLLHGFAGSWRHWTRNIEYFARSHRVIAADLPGLGDSAMPKPPVSIESIAATVAQGVDSILGPDGRYDLAGFSYGGLIAAHVALLHDPRLRSLTIIGTNRLGLRHNPTALVKVRHLSGEARAAAHAVNLSRMMIADRAKVDELAVTIQELNTRRSLMPARVPTASAATRDALARLKVRLNGVYGERDVGSGATIADKADVFRQLRPDVDFRIIPGAGHWVAYEAAAAFNTALEDMLRPR